MRLGGPILDSYEDPDSWIKLVKDNGYRAAYCPVGFNESDAVINSYKKAAEKADIIIAEAGAWSNPLSNDADERHKAIEFCKKQLDLADKIGALSCVNIAGSRGKKWDGPDEKNLTGETFDMIVDTVRKIIDEVKPKRTFYALETMPWIYPDSVESYIRLIHAIDRKAFAVHLDIVNLICSPQRYFSNASLIKECFHVLAPYIKGCHAKDIRLEENLTVHLSEAIPGQGKLDYKTLLTELNKLHKDVPLMLEHLNTKQEYVEAYQHIKSVADNLMITI